ncbi:MAG: MFS transporter [Candidatus Gastranaerophilales bacterium]|nr:MFS transporter [Candidatus Gastranaerophilales bacterium]
MKTKKAITWLSLGHLVNDSYTGFINPIMPFIAAKLGITMAMATVVLSISNICSSMLQPIFGFFADNMLKRVFIFWGLIMTSIFIPLTPLAPNIYLLIIFIILGSLGSSFYHPQATGFVNKFAGSGDNGARQMGFFISMGSIGYALGPLLAAVVTQYFDMAKMPVTSIMGLSLASLMFICVPKLSNIYPKPEYKKFKDSFITILTNRTMNLLMVISMMKVLVTTSCCTLLPFLWKNEMHYSPLYIGTALFLFVMAGGVGSLTSRNIEVAWGTKKLLYFSMIATLPMIILFHLTYQQHPIISLITFVVIGYTTMLAQPVTMVLGQKILPEFKSIVAGFMNGFAWGVIAVFLSLIGLCAQKFGITNVLTILAIFPAITSYIIKYIPNETVNNNN